MSGPRGASSRIVGLLLAAGRGRRMRATKQLMPWPPPETDAFPVRDDEGQSTRKTVVESAFDAIADHCTDMIVVLGYEEEAIDAALGDREYTGLVCDPDAEMFESIKCGMQRALDYEPLSGVLIQPADHPEVKASTVRAVIERHRAEPDQAVMPEYEGKGGHPVIVPVSLFEMIFDFKRPGGLRAFWESHPEHCLRLDLGDRMAVLDLDTPQAYRKARKG